MGTYRDWQQYFTMLVAKRKNMSGRKVTRGPSSNLALSRRGVGGSVCEACLLVGIDVLEQRCYRHVGHKLSHRILWSSKPGDEEDCGGGKWRCRERELGGQTTIETGCNIGNPRTTKTASTNIDH